MYSCIHFGDVNFIDFLIWSQAKVDGSDDNIRQKLLKLAYPASGKWGMHNKLFDVPGNWT